MMEVKSSMGLIVAAPTAGSCGAVPGAIFGTAQYMNLDDDKIIIFKSKKDAEEYIRKKPSRKESVKESDFDIAYRSKKDLSGKEIIDLNCDFIDFFHCDRIDLVDLKKDNPLLKYEIAQNSKLLYGEEIDYLKFKALAFRKYVDSQPLFKLQDILIKKRQEFLRNKIYGE